jgi:hypothetical protein
MKMSEPSRGLGDSIEKFTTATGMKTIVTKVNNAMGKTEEDSCGCKKRREALNKKFPYKQTTNNKT